LPIVYCYTKYIIVHVLDCAAHHSFALYENPVPKNQTNVHVHDHENVYKSVNIESSVEYWKVTDVEELFEYEKFATVDFVRIQVDAQNTSQATADVALSVVYDQFLTIATCFGFTYRVSSVPVATSASVAISTSHLFVVVANSPLITIISVPL